MFLYNDKKMHVSHFWLSHFRGINAYYEERQRVDDAYLLMILHFNSTCSHEERERRFQIEKPRMVTLSLLKAVTVDREALSRVRQRHRW